MKPVKPTENSEEDKVLTKKELEALEAEKIEAEERKKLDKKLAELTKQLDKPISQLEQLKVAHTKNGLEFAKPKIVEKPLFTDLDIELALSEIDVDKILENHGLKKNEQVAGPEFEEMIKQMVSIFLNKIDLSNPASIDAQIEELKEVMLAELGKGEI